MTTQLQLINIIFIISFKVFWVRVFFFKGLSHFLSKRRMYCPGTY